MKYYLFTEETRFGDYNVLNKRVFVSNATGQDLDKEAYKFLVVDDEAGTYEDMGHYYLFHCGDYAVSLRTIIEIPKEDYYVLTQYL